jgi:uncharacterized cupredoxin-like copper-binding protein
MLAPSRRLACLASLAAATVPIAASGCGSDDSDDTTAAETTPATTEASTDTASTTPTAGSTTLPVSETDFALAPADPTVKTGPVTIEVSNDGQTEHSLEVEGLPGGEKELEPSLQPGQKGSLTVDFTKPGTYEWYCPIGNHKEMGMKGEITVK